MGLGFSIWHNECNSEKNREKKVEFFSVFFRLARFLVYGLPITDLRNLAPRLLEFGQFLQKPQISLTFDIGT